MASARLAGAGAHTVPGGIVIQTRCLRILEIAFWAAMGSAWWLFPYSLSLFTQILIVGLFAVSLDMVLGYAGILTVGHAAFFGTGAYAAGLLAVHGWGEPFSGLLAAGAVSAVLGYLLGFLVVRGADLTRLMITIAVCLLLGEAALQFTEVTGGSDGLMGIRMWPVLGMFSYDLFGRTAFVYTLVTVMAIFALVRRMLNSPFGLSLRGISQNPARMSAIGAPVAVRLRQVYAMSAAVAGVAGALLAQTTEFVGVDTLSFERSAEILIVLVLGGAGRLYGGLVGALIYIVARDWLSGISPEYWMLGIGLLLIGVALAGRDGVLGLCDRLLGSVRRCYKRSP